MKKHKFYFITVAYWFLLLYIVSALVLWYIELERQNKQMYIFRFEQLHKDEAQYVEKIAALNDAKYRKSLQYVGEGLTFFVLIIVGAAYVYRTIRNQIKTADQQQNFMMAITHELKTPIAVTRLNLETLQKRKLQPEQQSKLIANTLVETERLNVLTNNILIAAQLEGGKYQLNKRDINLSGLTNACLKDFAVRCPSRVFHNAITEGIWIKGEYLLLQLLINNLVDNAVKYSPAGTPVTIRLSGQKNRAVFSITDEGEGIADVDKTKVFTKFYRVGSETVRKTKGTGLGLYLCRKIVKDHQGNISIGDNRPNGTIFTIHFPILNT